MNYKEELKKYSFKHRYFYDDGVLKGVMVYVPSINSIGASFCSPRDQFHKARGKYIALMRALRNMPMKRPVFMEKDFALNARYAVGIQEFLIDVMDG